MTLHVFNPEHDIALAMNAERFTPPRAARELRRRMWRLPEAWATEGDIVWDGQQPIPHDITAVEPWGWDRAIRRELRDHGCPPQLLPTDETLDEIRRLSHRRTAAQVLQQLTAQDTRYIGSAHECLTVEEALARLPVVAKAPWSCSGRGVRYITQPTDNDRRWLRNVIERQGSVMIERRCDKVQDFAMELRMHADGTLQYLGLNVFSTTGTAYTGNTGGTLPVANERLAILSERLVAALAPILQGRYAGPLGVDMMLCADDMINPCVEINLRRTMGHINLTNNILC